MPYETSNSNGENMYWSMDYSLVHLIALNSEYLVYEDWESQWKWLQQDLANVDRNKTPWIIASW